MEMLLTGYFDDVEKQERERIARVVHKKWSCDDTSIFVVLCMVAIHIMEP